MKIRYSLILICLLSLCGCVTQNVCDAAKADQRHDDKLDKDVGPVHWGYYCLLPLSVPVDVVTSPFQLIWFEGMKGVH